MLIFNFMPMIWFFTSILMRLNFYYLRHKVLLLVSFVSPIIHLKLKIHLDIYLFLLNVKPSVIWLHLLLKKRLLVCITIPKQLSQSVMLWNLLVILNPLLLSKQIILLPLDLSMIILPRKNLNLRICVIIGYVTNSLNAFLIFFGKKALIGMHCVENEALNFNFSIFFSRFVV